MNTNCLNPVYAYATSNYSTLEKDCNFAINGYLKHNPQPWFSEEDRREIFGDFRLKLLTSASSYNPKKNASIRTWSKFVALSSIIDYMRKHRDYLPIFGVNDEGEEFEIEELASKYSCEEEVIGWETQSIIDDCILSHSELEAQLTFLANSGYKVKELSEMFSIPAAKVSSILFSVRKDIKNAYHNAA